MCSTRHLFFCGLALLALLTAGCEQSNYPMLAALPTQAPALPSAVVVETHAYTDSDQCSISVTVQARSYDLHLVVEVLTEPGVILLGGNRLEANLIPYDSRTFVLNCVLEKHLVEFSGAYVVRALARHSGSDQEYGRGDSLLYVMAPLDQAPHFLGTEEEYKAQFVRNYIEGKNNLHYFLAFDRTQPIQGRIYIKVKGTEDGVGPLLNIEMSPGVHLVPDISQATSLQALADSEISARLPAIPAGGERIVVLPFYMEECLPGTYHLRVTTHHSQQLVSEIAPLYIRITEGPGGGQPSPPKIEKMEPRLVTPRSARPTLPEQWHETAATPVPPATQQLQLGAVSAQSEWGHPLNGFAGTRKQLYHCYLLEQVSMDWPTFAERVVEQNPWLRTDNFVFQRGVTYYLPVPVGLYPEPTDCLARNE